MITRREFGVSAAILLAGLWLADESKLFRHPNRFLVLGHSDINEHYFEDRSHLIAKPATGYVHIHDRLTGRTQNIAFPFLPHGISQFTRRPSIFATFPKWGTQGAIFDAKDKRILKDLTCPDGYRFFGHGVFGGGSGRPQLFATVSSTADDSGAVACYEDGILSKLYLTRDLKPHDIRFDHSGELLVIPHLHSFILMRAEDGEILSRLPTPYGSHLVPISDFEWIGHGGTYGGTPQPQAYLIDVKSGRVVTNLQDVWKSVEGQGELLSGLLVDSQNVIMTMPSSRSLIKWNFRTNKISQIPTRRHTNGITRNRRDILLNADGALCELHDETSVRPEAGSSKIGNGRHLYSFDIPT